MHVIFNPEAGGLRRHPGHFERTLSLLREKWPEVQAIATEGPQTAGPIAARCVEQESGLILIAGGDGTINEALAGVAGSTVPLGILPFGNANVLANELGLGNNPLRAAALLPACAPVPISLGRMSTSAGARLFVCMAGVGFDARTVRIVDPALKRRIGKFSYWLYAFQQIGVRLPSFRVRVSGREYLSSFALVSRVRNYGGDLAIARRANLLEDRFAIVLFSGESTLLYVKYLLGAVFNALDHMHGVRVLEATNVEVEPLGGESLDLQLDGEHAGFGAARFEIVEGHIRLLIPAPYLSVMTPATVRLQYESP